MNPKHILLLILTVSLATASGCRKGWDGGLIRVDADPQAGFHFPYFLYLPESLSPDSTLTLVVEPNNSGFASDDLKEHLEKAKRTATLDYYLGNYVATRLEVPLLVPVFPRPESQWKIYTHALDRDVMMQKGNELERPDLQLLAMITDATGRLEKKGYQLRRKVWMTGFSASGTFVNRFSLLHPGRVRACAAGGLNGLLMLPMDSLEGSALPYPLGTSEFSSQFHIDFDSAAFRELPQFLFMGSLDENDAIPYDDGYEESDRSIIYGLLGQRMQPDRWEACRAIYRELNIHAVIRTYEGIGHEHPDRVKQEVVEFFRSHMP
jgi:hypothetical protein